MQKQLIIVVVVLLLVVAGAYYYFTQYQSSGDQEEITAPEQIEGSGSFGSDLFEQSGNPAQNVPDTNPFQDVNTNPLEGINPFGSGYKNPFE